MYLRLLHTAGFTALALCLSGCPKKTDQPNPSDTVMGAGAAGNREDWINETDASMAEGLMLRDGGLFDGKMPHSVYASIFFEFDNFSLKAAERENLSRVADYLKQNPSATILLEGHCDWHGTTEYNIALGDKRAVVVKDYLTELGVSSDRMETLSKGSLEATFNLDKVQAGKDRRVDILLLK